MNFKAHENKTNSNRLGLYLKNWASYGNFCVSSWGEISIFQNFKILKSRSFFKILPNFLHVSSISRKVQLMYSNIGPKTNSSLISDTPHWRGTKLTPPGLSFRAFWTFLLFVCFVYIYLNHFFLISTPT